MKKGALNSIGACIKDNPERGAFVIKGVLVGRRTLNQIITVTCIK